MAFALLQGADESAAERFIRARFDDVCMELSGAPPGKLVNLAVFDHVFEKKPLRPPVATLVWKDWKNPDPEIRFPMRPGTSMPPPSLGRPSQPAPGQSPVVLPPPAPSAPPKASSSSPAVPATAAPAPAPAFPVSPKAPVHADVATPASTPIAIRRESAPQPTVSASPIVDVAAAPPAPTTARLGSAPPPQLASQPAPQPAAQAPASAAKPAPSAAPQQPRARKPTPAGGVDIVAELFEVMHDLHFLRDVQEGAEFVQQLALEKLQSQYAIVQLYDINKREFVIARAAGPNAASTVGGRTSERDPLLTEIMQRRTPFVIDVSNDPRVRVGRWAALGGEPALVLAAAVAQGGRFLGVLEVGCAPGRAYVKQHVDGMAYIADAFSEFLVARGIVFSADTPPPR
jgi:hypothetical protein